MNANAAGADKLTAISDLIRLPRQQGTLLVLWPTLWSLFIASNGRPEAKHLVVFILGTFLMRSAGCAINDIADRGFDPHVERTKSRPLASGALNVKEALAVFFALSALAFALVLTLNRFTVMLSFGGIALAAAYPFVKRFSHFPQTVLGVAFGWGVVMAWGAVYETVGVVALLLFGANICWSMAYDTIYALMDMDDDMKIGVKSTALYFGKRVWSALFVMYAGMFALLAAAGLTAGLGGAYFLSIGISLALFVLVVGMVKRNPTRRTAFNGFLANAAIGGVILAGIILDMNI